MEKPRLLLEHSIQFFADDFSAWKSEESQWSKFAKFKVPKHLICIGAGAHGKVYTDLLHAYKVAYLPKSRKSKGLLHFRSAIHEAILMNSLDKSYSLQSSLTQLIVKKGLIRAIVHQLPLAKSNLCRVYKTMTIGDIQNMIRQVGSSIMKLHQNGILHGDIKPENVLLISGRYTLCDYSISVVENITCCRPLGTFYYRPPEIFKGLAYTQKSDIWSFGVLILDCLYGCCFFKNVVPIDSYSDSELTKLHIKTSKLLKLSPEVAALLDKMLCNNPKKRFSALEVLDHPFVKNSPNFDEKMPICAENGWKFQNLKRRIADKFSENLPSEVVNECMDFIFEGKQCKQLDSKLFHFLNEIKFTIPLTS